MRYSFEDATAEGARKTQFYSMLGSRGIWHEGWKAVTNHPTLAGWGEFNDDEWELYHTDVDRAELHNLAAEMPDKVRELVNLWFAEAGRNDAFPLEDRVMLDLVLIPRPQLSGPREKLHLLPGQRRGPREAVGQHPQSLLLARRAGRHPGAGRRGRPVRARRALRRARPLHQGQQAPLRLQLRGPDGAEDRRDRGRPDRREPDPVCLVREGRRGSARVSPPASCRSTTGTRRSARGGSRPSPASSRSPAKGSAWGVTAVRPSPTTTPANRRTLHGRRHQAGARQRQREALSQPGARGAGDAHARVIAAGPRRRTGARPARHA